MPPGYAAFFLWVAAAVLWWSGWREETAAGIPDRAVAVFLAGWPLTAWKNTVLADAESISVNGAFMWTSLAMAALALRMEASARWVALSAGVFTGSAAILLTFAPMMVVWAPDWARIIGLSVIIALMTPVLTKGAAGQILAVSTALSLCEVLSAVWQRGADPIVIGNARWMECWWISVLAARLVSVLAATAARLMGPSGWNREGEGT